MQLTSILRRAAQVNPNGAANVFLDRSRTYPEVLDRVARLAGALQGVGMGVGDRVAMLSLNSDRYIEYYFGTVWGGGVMMPMNVRWAPAECAYALNDAGAKILLVDDAFAPAVATILEQAKGVTTVIHCGEGETPDGMLSYEALVAAADPAADAGRSGDDMAGLFYTGGTTGFPKGVMLSHTSLFVGGISNSEGIKLYDGAVYLHAAPMFHIADLLFFTAVTFAGGCHVTISMFTPDATLQAIEQHKPTHILLVPVMLQMTMASPNFAKTDVSSIEVIGYGASPISEAVLRQAFELFPKAKFIQAFGQTELGPVATILGTEYHVLDGPKAGKLRSAGRATRVVEIRIVDPDGNDVAQGDVGHIIVKGPVAMLGYWNKPDVTAETIREGWVYTGDAGHMDAEGFVYLSDRMKDMIVSGGENVYSIEVENALMAHDAIAGVAVIGIPHEKWGESVHAIVILAEGAEADEDDIKAHCHKLIAGYKCPRSISFRDEPFPLSGANKILKNVLRSPYWEGQDRQIS